MEEEMKNLKDKRNKSQKRRKRSDKKTSAIFKVKSENCGNILTAS